MISFCSVTLASNGKKTNLMKAAGKRDHQIYIYIYIKPAYIICFIDQMKLGATIASSADIWMILKKHKHKTDQID